MDRPWVGGADKKYAEGWDRIFRKKTPKEQIVLMVHKVLVRIILGRKL